MPDAPAETYAVEVWTITLACGDVAAADLELLDDDERVRVTEFTSEPARRSYVASHALLRRALGDHLGVDPGGLRFDRTCDHCGHPRHGRPRLMGGGVSFNLSHSGPHVLVAVGRGPVGADIEDAGRRSVADRVVRRCCSPREQAWLAGLAPADRAGAFLGLWTKKEAVAKALGLGLVLPFSTFEVAGPDPIVARDGAPPLVVHGVEVTGAMAAVATSPGVVIRHPG
ncbi:MAG: 4'-phosphopantetheinyl transferase superfamily protein [Actinomycetota bacterium]|nr:4'-phosphopantetheinyl transferase superfamily protein [Actinomycetota bacterium]